MFTVSDDVKIQGQPLKAGSYGLHYIVGPDEWTAIFSNNSTSWGSFFYDPAEDALRVNARHLASTGRDGSVLPSTLCRTRPTSKKR